MKKKILVLTLILLSISLTECKRTDSSKKQNNLILKNTLSAAKIIQNKIDLDINKSFDYKRITIKDFPIEGKIRKEVRITVPNCLNRETLLKTLKKAVYDNFIELDKPNAISILAYKENENTDGIFTVAKIDFAPFGDWGNTNNSVHIENYALNIDINDSYFQTVPKIEKKGTQVTAFNDTKYVNRGNRRVEIKTNFVDIFSDPKNLVSENKIGEIPNNSKVEIIDTYNQSLAQGYTWIAYKVKYKNKSGWVGEGSIKKN